MRQDQPSTSGQSSLSTEKSSSVAGSCVSSDEIQIVPKLNNGQVDQNITAGYYLHPKTLGKSQFGKVRLATHVFTFQHVALKVINKKRFRNERDKRSVYNEINSLKVLKHGSISRLLHLIENEERIYIVREYCSKGDLYDYVQRKGKLSESESRTIFRDLIDCLAYMHERGFSHGDIRPENALLDSSFRIKLIGFQFAHLRFDGESAQELANTSTTQYINDVLACEWTAPEILKSLVTVCTPAIDVWNAGILLYYITTGKLPFTDDSLVRLFKKIEAGIFDLPCKLSTDVCDLLVQMLKVDPLERANVRQILSHQWLGEQFDPKKSNEVAVASESQDILDDNVLNECLLLHSHEVQNDIVQLRFNIRYKFCYQTATYWLIKENFEQYKRIDLKLSSQGPKMGLQRLRQIVDRQSRHTFSPSRAVSNSPNVLVKSCKSKLDDEKCTITTSLEDESSEKSEQSSESKKRNKLVKLKSEDASIVNGASQVHAAKLPDSDESMWPAKAKSHFNLRRIFSKPQIADKRSNTGQSIESNFDHGSSCPQVLSHHSSLSLKKPKSLSRRLSTVFFTKFFGKNLSQINSVSTVNKNQSEDVTGKRVYSPPRRDQSQSWPADTTDSETQRVSRTKTIRFHSPELGQDEADGQQQQQQRQLRDNGSDTATSSSLLPAPIKDSVLSTEAVKINRQKAMPLTGSTVAIITRYSNYEECRDEAARLLAKKGINCKADKHKMRCCCSAMDQILLAFHIEFLTFPSLNGGSFVMIKAKKLRGNKEDFHVIADYLTTRFERRHLRHRRH